MAIFKPGQRFRYHNILSKRGGKRNLTPILSLTAMVDMFTVLVIFLLQNYNATGEILHIPKEVVLPQASAVRELKPAHVVTISNKEILLDTKVVATFEEVKGAEDWMINNLRTELVTAMAKSKAEAEGRLQNKIRGVVDNVKGQPEEEKEPWSKITVQCDKGIDFGTVKKVMYTVTEAGASEINFAVMKSNEETVN